MGRGKPDRRLDRVVKQALRLVPVGRAITKEEFEAIHNVILTDVMARMRVSDERLRVAIDKVLKEFPGVYGRVPERSRSWPALIRCLYNMYLSDLGTKSIGEAP